MSNTWANVVWDRSWWGVRSLLVDFEPRVVLPLHAHPGDHIYVLARGTYSAALDRGPLIPCGPGTIVFRQAHQPHWDEIGPQGCTDLRLELPSACRVWLPSRPGFCLSESLCERAAQLAGHRPDSRNDFARAYVELFNLLWEVRRRLLERDDPPWMGRFMDVLYAYANDDRRSDARQTPERIARRIGISRSTLQQWAHRRCGVAVGRLIRQVRALAAARRIVNTSTKLACIAFDSGFADQPHLTRELRRWLGTTPAQLRCNVCNGDVSKYTDKDLFPLVIPSGS